MQNFCLGMVNGLSKMTLAFDITKGSEIEALSCTSRRYTTEIHKPSSKRQRDRAKIWNRAGVRIKGVSLRNDMNEYQVHQPTRCPTVV